MCMRKPQEEGLRHPGSGSVGSHHRHGWQHARVAHGDASSCWCQHLAKQVDCTETCTLVWTAGGTITTYLLQHMGSGLSVSMHPCSHAPAAYPMFHAYHTLLHHMPCLHACALPCLRVCLLQDTHCQALPIPPLPATCLH